jgi:hypothetical protein
MCNIQHVGTIIYDRKFKSRLEKLLIHKEKRSIHMRHMLLSGMEEQNSF